MTHMLRALAPVLAATDKLPVETVHRRIAEACLRLARRNDEAKRAAVQALLDEAVRACVDQHLLRQPVRHCYRQFQWAALKEGLDTTLLPSESTFRRRVRRARFERFGAPRRKCLAVAPKSLEAAVLRVLLASFEVMPDRSLRLRDIG